MFDARKLDFGSESGMGDIGFDLVYAQTSPTGLLSAYGFVATLPTATEDDLGKDLWAIGPEVFVGRFTKQSVIGIWPSHQWDVGGSGDGKINSTSMQVFGVYLPGGGWNFGTAPIFVYDHELEESTVPLNFSMGKTVIWSGRPWKLGMEINYYLEKPDAFGPEWMISFDITPVVENPLARWFK